MHILTITILTFIGRQSFTFRIYDFKTRRRPFLSRQDDLLLEDNTSFARSRLFMNVFLATT